MALQPTATTTARALGLALAVLLAACPAKLEYPECKADAACASHGQICAKGFCRQCRDDTQCKAGETCNLGGCVARAECNSAAACAPGLLCRAGKCTAECTEATGSADCGFGRKCVESRCTADDSCQGDGDCGAGKACVENRCRAQGDITGAAATAKLSCDAGPIFFEYDSSTLDPHARAALNDAWACVQREGFRYLLITGHTDERGTTEYNLALGGRRAEGVRKYLIGLGASGRKLRSVSFGKERPADAGHTEAAWEKNRRVEINLEK